MTLTDFLLARIAEEERVATESLRSGRERYPGEPDFVGTFNGLEFDRGWLQVGPGRVLAECAAKRAQVKMHAPWLDDSVSDCQECGHGSVNREDDGGDYFDPVEWPCPTIRHLAAVYAGHPDYDESWRL